MADVIPFAQRRRFSRSVRPGDGVTGQILFFTGVRYERQAEAPAQKPGRRPRPAGGRSETRSRRPG